MSLEIDPARALVLAVGIEQYAHGAGMDLPGAAAEAARFARWALDRGVPPQRVLLACSWLDRPQPPDGVRLVGTKGYELSAALRETATADGDLLLLFWCGHGVLNEDNERALFTSDASRDDKQNILVDELLAYLRSTSLTRFGRQILLIDACANSVTDMQFDESLPQQKWQKGKRQRAVEQFAYFSAAQGQIAQFNKIERQAMFSSTVLGWLECQPSNQFPPDVTALTRHVDDVFERAREAGRLRQVPVYQQIRNYQGSVDEFRHLGGGIPVTGATQAAIQACGMTVSQVRRVATAVAAIPDLSTSEGREHFLATVDASATGGLVEVIARLLAEGQAELIFAALDARAKTESEALLVQQIRHSWERQERIAPAVRAFQTVTGEQVRNAYFRAVPAGDGNTPEDLDHAMDLAAAYGTPADRHAPLHRLVAALEHATHTRVDDAWFRLSSDRLNALRAEAAIPRTDSARLVVDLRAAAGAVWPDEIAGHLYFPGKGWDRSTEIRCEPSVSGAQQAVATLIEWVEEDKGVSDFTVGLIVPRAGLDSVPEAWEYGNPLEEPTPLWHQRSTVLHSAERLSIAATRNRWQTKVAKIKERLVNEAPEVLWIEHLHRDSPEFIRSAVRDSVAACVGLAFAPGEFCHDLRRDPIIAMIAGGAPFVLWTGQDPADWQATKQELLKLVAQGVFDELPQRVHRVRTADTDGLGRTLRLMWDEPGALPPFGHLAGVSDGSNHG